MKGNNAPKALTTQPNLTLAGLFRQYSTEEACKGLLRDMRWPNGVECPRCKRKERVYALKARPFHWVCKNADCGKRQGYRFSVITKTIFENTNYPLKTWFQVIYLMSQSKKGMSALQIHRQIGSGSYKTAWYMVMRIRAAMQGDAFPLTGQIEVDETYVGGQAYNRHGGQINRHGKGPRAPRGTFGKIAVIGAIARKGNVVCKVIENTDTATLDKFVRTAVNHERVDLVATDEHSGYRLLSKGADGLPHQVVRHSGGEYVRGIVHTNSIEGFWSLLKRGIVGSYHNVSKKYLPLYLNEFSFRYNNRNNPDIFRAVLAGC
ncbi:MAG TPA: IS1595 family transposase [Candidatus Binataceae bacterium]|nr:IS1595 family transposase [Candidatus Binataceae bacterium]